MSVENLKEAQEGEDDFDACLTAAALLRCVLDGSPLHSRINMPASEGGMLGTGSIDLSRPAQIFGRSAHAPTVSGAKDSRDVVPTLPTARIIGGWECRPTLSMSD